MFDDIELFNLAGIDPLKLPPIYAIAFDKFTFKTSAGEIYEAKQPINQKDKPIRVHFSDNIRAILPFCCWHMRQAAKYGTLPEFFDAVRSPADVGEILHASAGSLDSLIAKLCAWIHQTRQAHENNGQSESFIAAFDLYCLVLTRSVFVRMKRTSDVSIVKPATGKPGGTRKKQKTQ